MSKKPKTSKLAFALSIGGFIVFTGSLIFLAFYFWDSSSDKQGEIKKVKTFFGFNREIAEPFGIASKDGDIYVSDGKKGKILKIKDSENFEVLTDKLDTPSAIDFDSNGNLIIADTGSHTIKKLILETGEVEIIAGKTNEIGYADGLTKNATFNAPVGIAVGENDEIYITDTYNDRIRVIENGFVSTLAGSTKGFADGDAFKAKFDTPCGIALTTDGKLLVADSGNYRIRIVEPNGNTKTLAGNNSQNSFDSTLSDAKFVRPMDVEIDERGLIYVTDGNSIRVIGGRFLPFVETISNTERGFADGLPWEGKFNRPSGLAIDKNGDLFVADSENQVVRVFTDSDIGKVITYSEIEKLKFTAEEFRKRNAPNWTFEPQDNPREIAGTMGEIRGEVKDENSEPRFHNGLDITGAYGETAVFIRDEIVLNPYAVENFGNLRELIILPELTYIHIRLGRDEESLFNDSRFQFLFNKDQTLRGLRVSRGTKFAAGDKIGTLNRMNHVHLVVGSNRNVLNGLDALVLPEVSDERPPVIEEVKLYDEGWQEFETEKNGERIKLAGKIRIVVQAYDQMDRNADRRKLGIYKLGYQVLQNEEPLTDTNWTIIFDKLPPRAAAKLVFAKGSQSGATGETIFRYIASNKVNGDDFREAFLDASDLASGEYTLQVFAADFFGNQTSKEIKFKVEN